MATRKKKAKSETMINLYFETLEHASLAKDLLGEERRRPSNLNKGDHGSYSKMTGHYGFVNTSDGVCRVNINYKLIVPLSTIESLTFEEKQQLRILDGDSSDWIVQ